MKNITNKMDKKIIAMKILMAFIIIQPFLDFRPFFTNEHLQVLGLTIPTLARCIGLLVMCLLVFLDKPWKKEYIFYIVYFIFLGFYFIGHHLYATSDLALPTNYTYSLFGEAFYIIRMIFPFIVVYLSKTLNITYKRFIACIQIVSLTIGLVIIVSNLLHISLTSYYSSDMYNKLNFIEWFTVGTDDYLFEELTSKGWFFMANQISGLMLLMLPINLYDFLKNQTKLGIISTFSLSISMILLGTRVATFGALGMLIVFFILFIGFKIIKKESLQWKKLICYAILAGIMGVLFVGSPINNRVYSYGDVNVEEDDEKKWPTHDSSDDTEREKYILEHYKDFKISDKYIFSIYPYYEDSEFWYDFMETYTGAVQNNRQMQQLIVRRIAELNDTPQAKLFGYSYTRFTSGGLYLEQDFAVHYYTIGILGVVLLLGPWIFYLAKMGCVIVYNFKKKFTFLNCSLLGGIVACLGSAWFSGHIVDELIVTLILGFVVGFGKKVIEGEGSR